MQDETFRFCCIILCVLSMLILNKDLSHWKYRNKNWKNINKYNNKNSFVYKDYAWYWAQYQTAPRPDEVNCKVHETLVFQEWIWIQKKPAKYIIFIERTRGSFKNVIHLSVCLKIYLFTLSKMRKSFCNNVMSYHNIYICI